MVYARSWEYKDTWDTYAGTKVSFTINVKQLVTINNTISNTTNVVGNFTSVLPIATNNTNDNTTIVNGNTTLLP